MRVDISLLLTFQKHAPQGSASFELELAQGDTVDHVLERLGIAPDTAKVVIVNGRLSTGGRILHDGDTLTVFPPLEGG